MYVGAHNSDMKVSRRGEYGAEVQVKVTNTGSKAGSEVPQVYIHQPRPSVSRPEVELAGFAKIHLEPGESKTAVIPIDHKAFSYYDVSRKCWVADSGVYEFRVGPSSTVVSVSKPFKLEKSFRWIVQQEPQPL